MRIYNGVNLVRAYVGVWILRLYGEDCEYSLGGGGS